MPCAGWFQSLAISFAIGWLVFDPIVIIVRSNIKFTKKIMKTRRYQVIEKFVVMPVGAIVKWFGKMMKVALGGD